MRSTGEADVPEVARRQKHLIALIGINILGYVVLVALAVIIGEDAAIVNQVLGVTLYVGVLIAYLYLIVKLARAMRLKSWVYFILAFIPVVSLLSLLVLSSDATGVLKRNNVRVGLFGANNGDLRDYEARMREAWAGKSPTCPGCGQAMQPSWNACPGCGHLATEAAS